MPFPSEPRLAPLTSSEKLRPLGRFFCLNSEKFFLKGVTYGPFLPSRAGVPFPEATRVETDFSLMTELGANCLRTFTPPPDWFLDRAACYGLRVITGIPWSQFVFRTPPLGRETQDFLSLKRHLRWRLIGERERPHL
jgi:beta-galactosidase/beta-glucuronidase